MKFLQLLRQTCTGVSGLRLGVMQPLEIRHKAPRAVRARSSQLCLVW